MIAILKYNAGNSTSVENALLRLGYDCVVTDDKKTLLEADKVIFPGVGEAKSAMRYLKNKGLDQVILNLKQPVLGICLGLQLMCSESEEGNTKCLGIFKNKVLRFNQTELVPHMGWNNIAKLKGKLLKGIENNADTYFAHSYYAELSADTAAICEYIVPFSAALERKNFYATQFHPEKSASIGEKIVKNFLEL
ncbi:MAG: imidazole glycerol phosphate synthase subunit HisH [Flavobacteriales bacterium]|jgi:glutamine amidotransferase|tara:strand:- start:1801 stop:2379 length:579 start_codon:yes stop_codon:yes gene_type:complete